MKIQQIEWKLEASMSFEFLAEIVLMATVCVFLRNAFLRCLRVTPPIPPITPPTPHNTIMNTLSLLGYPPQSRGICLGFTMRWVEACLLGEEVKFNRRIKTILMDQSPLEKLTAIKAKVSNHEELDPIEDQYLEIPAFYESMLIYQNAATYKNIFNQHVNQCDIEQTSQLTSAQAIQQRGGLVAIYSEPWLFTDQDITNWFKNLAVAASNMRSDKITLMITSIDHAIGMTYDSNNGNIWTLMDINKWHEYEKEPLSTKPAIHKVYNTNAIAAWLRTSFNIPSNMERFAFTTHVITIADDSKITPLRHALEKIATTHHVITDEIAKSKQVNQLAYLAVVMNRVNIITHLAISGLNLNSVFVYNKALVLIAVEHGHVQLLAELVRRGADLNENHDLACTVAQYGRNKIMSELAKLAANLKKTFGIHGYTLAHKAAHLGHTKVITELARLGADLKKTCGIQGHTLAHIAENYGHNEVIAELAKLGVNIHTSNHWGFSIMLMAIFQKNVNLVQFMLEDPSYKPHPLPYLLSKIMQFEIFFVNSMPEMFIDSSPDYVRKMRRMGELIAYRRTTGSDVILEEDMALYTGDQRIVDMINEWRLKSNTEFQVLKRQIQEKLRASHNDHAEFANACTNMMDLLVKREKNGVLSSQDALHLMKKTKNLVDNPKQYKELLTEVKKYREDDELSACLMLIGGWSAKIATFGLTGKIWIDHASIKLSQIENVEQREGQKCSNVRHDSLSPC